MLSRKEDFWDKLYTYFLLNLLGRSFGELLVSAASRCGAEFHKVQALTYAIVINTIYLVLYECPVLDCLLFIGTSSLRRQANKKYKRLVTLEKYIVTRFVREKI